MSFQPQWNVTDEYFFFPHFIQKAHLVCSRLCEWVFACVYVHWWEWFRSRFGVVVFSGFSFSWFQKSLFRMRAAVWRPWVSHAKPQIFTIHLCVYAAVKSTNTLINHTSKSNVKSLLRKKKKKFFLSTKDFKKKEKTYSSRNACAMCMPHRGLTVIFRT